MKNTNGVSALRHYRLSHIRDNSPCQCHCARPSRRMLYKDSNISAFNIITPCYDLGYYTSLTVVFRLARRIALVGRDHQWYWGIRRRCPTTVSILDGFFFSVQKPWSHFGLLNIRRIQSMAFQGILIECCIKAAAIAARHFHYSLDLCDFPFQCFSFLFQVPSPPAGPSGGDGPIFLLSSFLF
ncbi:hypothetical protein BDQ94DRAFT_141989 [Aspergillus welwitschiae]|uniref:Uncharacterized protein n=1 Tax=Aspergillus welwitschiae TaxID=1341132 RepID=A0A3F3Q4P7_9EURO|nr:hypothetical protein BDQ94DRAFT_141989 [Aspergillus welwitschiae]RDH34065.1 hypothetical protein BDQ94DRAFT_141989 [Aspergillus welwitschiae]